MFGVFVTMELSSALYAYLDDGERCRLLLAARMGPYDHHWLYACADAWDAWLEARALDMQRPVEEDALEPVVRLHARQTWLHASDGLCCTYYAFWRAGDSMLAGDASE